METEFIILPLPLHVVSACHWQYTLTIGPLELESECISSITSVSESCISRAADCPLALRAFSWTGEIFGAEQSSG